MNFFFAPILFVFFSCNTIKIKKLELDSTQDLIGNIEQIDIRTFRYPSNEKDTTVSKVNSMVFFDGKNKIIKQFDYYGKFNYETDFIYKNNVLDHTVSKSGKTTSKIEYKYDHKNNLIECNKLENDTLYVRKTSVYDKQNNPIEQIYFYPNYRSLNGIEKFTYDYKNKTVHIRSLDENNNPKNRYLKTYFNKKGYRIKTESIPTDSKENITNTSIFEYDKLGNLTKISNFDHYGKPKDSIVYKNTYDEKGNIIVREKFWKQKLIEKTTYQITYR